MNKIKALFQEKNHKGLGVTLLLCLILLGWIIQNEQLLLADQPNMQTTKTIGSPNAPEAPDGLIWSQCTPVNVAAYEVRIHVRCAESTAGIYFYALATNDSTHTARVLSILSTANVAGRTLFILNDPGDLSGSSIGCLVSDCRLILAAEMH